MPYSWELELRAWPWLPRAYVKSVQEVLGHASAVDARNDALTSRYRRPAERSGPQRGEDPLSAPEAERSATHDHYRGRVGNTE